VPDSLVPPLPFRTILQRGALEGLLFQRPQGSGYGALVAPASRLNRTAILPLRLITCDSVEGEREKCSVSHFSCLGVCRSVNGVSPTRRSSLRGTYRDLGWSLVCYAREGCPLERMGTVLTGAALARELAVLAGGQAEQRCQAQLDCLK